jgi:hypothetical protein
MERRVLLDHTPNRFVIVHYHIMKNAGMTIASILEREFGDGFYDVHRNSPNGHITPDDLTAFLAATPSARALSSHHFRFPVPPSSSIRFFDCCPVRHPLDRLESLYTFFRTTPPTNSLVRLAHSLDLPEFLRTLLEKYPDQAMNLQTRTLANSDGFRPADVDDLERAIRVVRKSAMLALVNRLDESLAAAEYFMAPAFPDLRLHYTAHNVARAAVPFAKRVQLLRDRCGEGLFRQLERANELDLQLVDAAEEELERRISFVPSFPSRLKTFRESCTPSPHTFA